ncbi:unnamed protein product [Amoebophrya sp. A25]|nr:unnamed protein product [Amoebophrya sp. A25]|eukprot:GSA25T00009199001.1
MGLLFFRKDSFLFPAWLTCHLAGMTSHAGAVFVTTPAAHGQTSAEQQQGVEEDSSTQEQPPLAPSSLREEDSSTQEQPPLAPSSLRTTLKKDLKNLLTCCSRRWRQPSSTPLLRDEDQQGEPVGTSTTDTTAKAPARTQNSGNVEAEQRGEEASMTNAEDRVEGQGEQQAPAGEEEAPQAPQAEPEVADQVESDLEYADEEEPGVADHSDDQVVQEAERFVTRLNAPENAARRPLVDRFFKSRTASPASWEYFQLGARGNKLSRVLHARLDHDRVREYAEDLVKHRFPRVLPDLEQLRRQFLDDQQSVRARNAIARQNRITALEWRRSRARLLETNTHLRRKRTQMNGK